MRRPPRQVPPRCGGPLRRALAAHTPSADADPATTTRTSRPSGGKPTRLHPPRVLGASLLPPPVDVPAPRHRLGLDDPGPVIGERSDHEIRGKRAVDHPRNVRGAGRLDPPRRPYLSVRRPRTAYTPSDDVCDYRSPPQRPPHGAAARVWNKNSAS